MNLISWSIIFIVLWAFMFLMIVFIIYAAIKKHTYLEGLLKPLILCLFVIIMYMVYFIGLEQNEGSMTYANVLKAFTSSLQVFTSNFDVDAIESAMQTTVYRVAYYLNAISAAIFAIYTVICLLEHMLVNKIRLTLFRKKECYYVFGEVFQIEYFLSSLTRKQEATNNKRIRIVVVPPSDQLQQLKKKISDYRYAYLALDIAPNCLYRIINVDSKNKQSIISLYEDDSKNIQLINNLYAILQDSDVNLQAYIYMNDLEDCDMSNYDIVFNGKLSFFNYAMISSFNLVFQNPGVEKSHIEKHYIMIGFGDTNRQVLIDYIITNTTVKNKCKYTIISNDTDITTSKFYKNMRFFEKDFVETDYLDKPLFEEVTKNLNIVNCDINSKEFFDMLDLQILNDEELVFIVAVGEDIFNLKATQIIQRYIDANNLKRNTSIYTRIKDRNMDITKILSNKTKENSEGYKIIRFGDISEVFSFRNIVNQDYAILAQRVHNVINDIPIPDSEDKLIEQWNQNSLYNRRSSIYAVLSIRNKLRYIGLDLTESKSIESISEEDYFKVYDPQNLRQSWDEVTSTKQTGKYFEDNNRNTLARDEHERWNNFMLFEGYTPMKVKELHERLSKNEAKPTKNQLKKRNICITTFEGLLEVAKILEKHNLNNKTEYFIDYINFDYRVMDRLPEIIKNSQYRIIRK